MKGWECWMRVRVGDEGLGMLDAGQSRGRRAGYAPPMGVMGLRKSGRGRGSALGLGVLGMRWG